VVGRLYFYEGDFYAFRGAVWPAGGGVRLLDDVPGGPTWSDGGMMNSRGQISGQGMASTGQRPVVWSAAGQIIDLGNLPGKTWGGTSGINDLGEVVGFSAAAGPEPWRAFVWTETEGMLDLNDLLDESGKDWLLTSAQGTNDSGQIITSGWFEGRYHAALLTPVVPEPAAAGLLLLIAWSAAARSRHGEM
jgi:probable HAF family extracellular repeat protein